MKHAKQQVAEPEREPSNPIRLFLAVVFFLATAALLWLVATGKLGSQEEYADGSLGPDEIAPLSEPVAIQLEIRNSIEDYSWAEISEISAKVQAAPSREEAIAIAKEYHLVNEDGTLPTTAKHVILEDGSSFGIQLAGILHDGKANENGMCGFTFVSSDAVAMHVMNSSGSVEGGWEGSEARSWLNSEYLRSLPQDLQDVLVPCVKLSNNQGSAYDTSAVSATGDVLFMLSAREVVGEIHWFEEEYGSGQAFWDSVVNAEGEQYQLFQQAQVSEKSDPNGSLVRRYQGEPVAWSYRTAFQYVYENIEGRYFYGVMDSGYPYAYATPETERGVVIGFCI